MGSSSTLPYVHFVARMMRTWNSLWMQSQLIRSTVVDSCTMVSMNKETWAVGIRLESAYPLAFVRTVVVRNSRKAILLTLESIGGMMDSAERTCSPSTVEAEM